MIKKSLLVIFLLQLTLFAANDQFAQKMNYLSDYNKALETSIDKYKPIMLVVGTKTCPWCKKLENQTLKKEQIDQFIKLHFTPLKLDKDKNIYPKDKFDAKVVPTVFFIDPKTEKAFHISKGYKNTSKFLIELEKAKKIYYSGEF